VSADTDPHATPPAGAEQAAVGPLGESGGGDRAAERPALPPRSTVWSPSPRLIAILAAATLALGLGVGAAIGPAPDASFAGSTALPLLLRSLLASRTPSSPASSVPGPSASAEPAAAAAPRHRRHRRAAAATAEPAQAAAGAGAGTSEASTPSSKPRSPASQPAGKPLPPVTKVWLIELSGSTFSEALGAPSSAPYIDSQAIPSGSLLAGWSSLQASAFASDAALIATSEPQLLNSVIQPPCPEGAAGAQCAPGTAGALSAANAFLEQALATITASGAYRSNGLVVVTFGLIAPGSASELPSGSTSATLASRPPAGALLISPFTAKGGRPTTTFNAASPRQSLEALLHR